MSAIETISEQACFGGLQGVYSHASSSTGTTMKFSLFRPPQAKENPVPVLWFLSGLTCTEENFTVKAGAPQYAAKHGLMLVAPDTSPRGLDLPGEHDDYDFGSGAGFYVDATEKPWSDHYNMYSYVTHELPDLVFRSFAGDKSGIRWAGTALQSARFAIPICIDLFRHFHRFVRRLNAHGEPKHLADILALTIMRPGGNMTHANSKIRAQGLSRFSSIRAPLIRFS